MVVVVASGGGALAAIGLIPNAAPVQVAVATTASKTALAGAVTAEAAGAVTVAEGLLSAAVAAESVATAATGVAAANCWNPAGWIIGGGPYWC